ncbi:DUF4861 family protein [Flavobacterium sp. ZS1P14]|uniref:DUF4861 family protein n=1 Tax=Flavobacterium sp. ZS1P14 TaxID=3401729 RepID=UPI003AAEEABE
MKLNRKNTVCFLGIIFLFSSFESKKKFSKEIVIENPLNIDRINEVVAIDLKEFKGLSKKHNRSNLLVKDQNGTLQVTQLIDNNLDGSPDELLFQAKVPALSKVTYTVFINKKETLEVPKSDYTTYARFVPERIDDFAWENDKVAFRTYGPEAQRLVDQGKDGGTLSSGIDIWLKKVKYSIIDSWYAKNVTAPGYYHIEHGEGYDPYHVGSSRGNGGTGIWEKDSLYTSKNYIKYRIIASGPLRTIFELDYAPWSTYGVKETKRICLDLGSNFSKFENKISATSAIPNYTIGITLHQEKGVAAINAQKGVFRHWEPIDDSFVGEGIVIDPSIVKTAMNHHSKSADQSQVLVVTELKNNSIVYYVGFAWTGSGQVQSVQDWDAMLEKQSQVIQNPLSIKIK